MFCQVEVRLREECREREPAEQVHCPQEPGHARDVPGQLEDKTPVQ